MMTIWTQDISGKSGPKFRNIADAIEKAIAGGELREGVRLPPQRELAYQLGVSLNTVTRAYAEARRRGLVHGEVGRGTYIRTTDSLTETRSSTRDLVRPESGVIDLSANLPCLGQGTRALAKTLTDLGRSENLDRFLDYQPKVEQGGHEAAGTKWIARLGLQSSQKNIILTSGAQHGIMVALMALLRPGDTLLVEQMTYAPLKQMAHHLSIKLCPVEMDEDGLNPEHLEEACKKSGARALYCMPTLHTPTTISMPDQRRQDIADIARRQNIIIIEDAVFSFLPRKPQLPLATYAPERSILITSVSKSLAPGLRVGYLVAPELYNQSIRDAVNMSCWMTPPLMAEIASRWINENIADKLNEWQRDEASVRQKIAADHLSEHNYLAHNDAFSIWMPLEAPWRGDTFRREAEARGVKVLSNEAFAVGQASVPHGVRICLGYEMSRRRVTKGLEIIADLLAGREGPGPSQI